MSCFALTDKGIIRKQNQDTCFVEMNVVPGVTFAGVCDGMGGAKSGGLASSLAANAFCGYLRKALSAKNWIKDVPSLLAKAVNEANEAVYRKGMSDEECRGMGTTLVALLSVEDDCYLVNVGDSRGYRCSSERIQQITRDHSLVAELLEKGQITEEQSRKHPHKNLITRAVGTEKQVKADIYCLTLSPGQIILLCSDGLSNLLSNEELFTILNQNVSAEELCHELIDTALSRGAPDNVSAVLYRSDMIREI